MKSFSILFSVFFFVPSILSAAALEVGANHTLFLDLFGQMWAVGNNDHGQLGIPNAQTLTVPTIIPFDGIIQTIAAGNQTSYAIDDKGFLWAWGKNDQGELGFGHTQKVEVPTRMDGLPKIAKISPGRAHTLAVDEEGGVWCWNQARGYHINGPQEWNNEFLPTKIHTVVMNKAGKTLIWHSLDGHIEPGRLGNKPQLLDIGHAFVIFQGDIQGLEQLGNQEIRIQSARQSFIMSPKGIEPATNYGPEYTYMASDWGRIFCRDKHGRLFAKGQNKNGELGLGNTGYQSEWATVIFPN